MRNRTLALMGLAAAAGSMAYANHRVAAAYRPIHGELDGRPDIHTWRDGIVYYHVKGEGQPIVLLHDFGIAAGSYQMQPTYDRLAQDYRVYAPDWLGFGQSTRPAADYTAGAYEQWLADFLAEAVREPAVLVAAGVAAPLAARVAARQPQLVSNLVLVCPTGVERGTGVPTDWRRGLRALLKAPLLGTFVWNLLASRPSLAHELRSRLFFDPALMTPELVGYAWITTHQPGARFALASLWSGLLNLSLAGDLPALAQPVMIVWGQQARKVPVEDIQAFKRLRPDARYRAFDRCGQWPQYEAANGFSALLRNWLQGKDTGAAAIFPGEVEPE